MIPIGPGPGDQHVLADKIEGKHGMDRVAERIEDRAELVVDVVGQRHDVERRHPHIFGKGARNVDANPARVRIEMIAAAARRPALHADHMALTRHALADLKTSHIGPKFGDLARVFVAHGHRRRDRLLRPLVPIEDMDVGAADAGLVYLDQYIVGANLGDRLLLEPQARLRLFLDEGFH